MNSRVFSLLTRQPCLLSSRARVCLRTPRARVATAQARLWLVLFFNRAHRGQAVRPERAGDASKAAEHRAKTQQKKQKKQQKKQTTTTKAATAGGGAFVSGSSEL